MHALMDLINGYGQIAYPQLCELVGVSSLSDFTSQAVHPFLVGKELYDGELKKKIGGSLASTSTLKFNVSDFRKDMRSTEPIIEPGNIINDTQSDDPNRKLSEEFTRSIYYPRKKRIVGVPSMDNTILIGRNGVNDIVISDKVISSKHAQLIMGNGVYHICDLYSTNGTNVNGVRIKPSTKHQLQLNDTIAFGRLCFVFTHPLLLYRSIRKDLMNS